MTFTGKLILIGVASFAAHMDMATTVFAQDKKESKDESDWQAIPPDQYVDGNTPMNKICVGVCPEQAVRALEGAQKKITDAEKPRIDSSQRAHLGFSAANFPKVAPATVLISTPFGFGTGFVIDDAGWIVTNEHVIRDGYLDHGNGTRFAEIHFGKLVDGFMEHREKRFKAEVYSASSEKDLAMLKLVEKPNFKLQTVKFAEKVSTPGHACFTIGNPTSGLLWTLRTGEISGVGRYPQDFLTDYVITGFTLQGEELKQFRKAVHKGPSRKTLISSIGLNPGDSGGPLLNTRGELIAVNFAIPRNKQQAEVSLDKFSYHVHLDEVNEFIKSKPDRPEVYVPPVLPKADRGNLFDKDNDGKFESWVFRFAKLPQPSGVIVDLDDNTPDSFAKDFADGKVPETEFEYEFGFQNIPHSRTFFDSNNDGQIDWILTDFDKDGVCDFAISATESQDSTTPVWKVQPAKKRAMRDYSLFENPKLGERLKHLFEVTVKGRTLEPGSNRPGG